MISKKNSVFVIGLALFAMFFGSGNLIYPLFVGSSATTTWKIACVGFLLTAVFLPFLGIIAMVLFKGSYRGFFNILGKNLGFLFSLVLLTVWIPLGSAPRCIALAYSSISAQFNVGPIWVFSLIYSFLVFFVITRKVGFLNILGKFITPLLVGSILIIFIKGFFSPVNMVPNENNFSLIKGMVEGYNTMDLIASFFFSASIIHILFKKTKSMSSSVKIILRSSLVGIGLLAFVYISLIFISAKYSVSLQGVRKDQLLAHLALVILGSKLSAVSILAIVLACFSTSVAIIVAYSDFLSEEVFVKNKKSLNISIILGIFISYVMSLFGLEGVAFITEPVLKICYPILLGLIFINIFRVRPLHNLSK